MERYLIFAFGNFRDAGTFNYVSQSLLKIKNSNYIKFINYGSSLIFYFGYSLDFNSLKEYVDDIMLPYTKSYFLIKESDKIFISMDKKDLASFLDLDSKTKENHFEYEVNDSGLQSEINKKSIFNSEKREQPKPKKHVLLVYDLDSILEKIKERGLGSLTAGEHKYLESFQKVKNVK